MKTNAEMYKKNGYIVLENFISKTELDDFEAYIQRLCERQLKEKGMTQKESEPLIDLFRIGGEYRKLLYQMCQHLPILTSIQNRMYNLLKEEGFLSALGFIAPMVRSGMIVALPFESQFDNPVHQDIFSNLSHRNIRFWIPLRKADSHYGSMRVYPGSHANGFVPHDDLTILTYPAIGKQYYSKYEGLVFDVPAGTAVIFSPLLMHESIANVSDKIKFVASVEIQDIAGLPNFNDPEDAVVKMMRIKEERNRLRTNQKGVYNKA